MNPGTPQFNKTIALNAGAKHAIGAMQADYLLFFDADTFVHKGFIEKISPLLDPKRFIFVRAAESIKDLTRLLVIHKDLFRESGGYEESFRNWGAEDLEFRLRLYAKHKMSFDVIDGEFLGSIQHEDELRTKFYTEQDIHISNKKNISRMRKMFALYRLQELTHWKHFPDKDNISKLLMFDP
jgi:predicted glycosyltransferase involved in capsule biosynthesis